MRKLVVFTVIVVALVFASLGAFFAVRRLTEPAPKLPQPTRVVKVNLQPLPG